MIRVGISGAAGRLGRVAAQAVVGATDLELGPLYNPGRAGEVVAGREITDRPEAMNDADVVVEATRPEVVMENLARWRDMGLHVVVGTSGFDRRRLAELASLWEDAPGNCLVVPNFSMGAVLMMRVAEMVAPYFQASEVVELHHDGKADAPSGTATSTAERIAAARPHQQRMVDAVELAEGARGADIAGVRVHAVRLPGLVAHQEVIFGNTGETLTIRHDTTSREAFASGILLAVRRVAHLPDRVTVGLDALLD